MHILKYLLFISLVISLSCTQSKQKKDIKDSLPVINKDITDTSMLSKNDINRINKADLSDSNNSNNFEIDSLHIPKGVKYDGKLISPNYK